jgi:hypothetical protein
MGKNKMTNELTTNLDFSVDYKKSEIKINNQEQLETTVQNYAKKYEGLIFTEDDIQEGKDVRAELNKVAAAIDDKRKAVKKEFNEPYLAFESNVKRIIGMIKTVSDPIDSGIKELEEKQKKEKAAIINEKIDELTKEAGLESAMIETSSTWLNKTVSFKKITENIVSQIDAIKKEEERKQGEISIVTNFCEALHIDSEGWLKGLERGETAAQIITEIQAAEKRKKEREEQRKKEEEARIARELEQEQLRAKREEEARLAAERAELEKANEQQETYLEDDVLTEENYTEDPFVDVAEPIEEEPVVPVKEEPARTAIIEITGTNEQFKLANAYMVSLGIQIKAHKD